jgi:methionine-S-sulfoxide reductase
VTDTGKGAEYRKATFAAGCFWGVEAAFRAMKGVVSTRVGYTGGILKNPSYHDVCTGSTGHAEAVEVSYDPRLVSYKDLLTEFFRIHDPTTLNRQGPDYGSQYRSAIFYHDEAQHRAASEMVAQLLMNGRYIRPIVTEIVPALEYYEAEEYHQQYFTKNKGYNCHI